MAGKTKKKKGRGIEAAILLLAVAAIILLVLIFTWKTGDKEPEITLSSGTTVSHQTSESTAASTSAEEPVSTDESVSESETTVESTTTSVAEPPESAAFAMPELASDDLFGFYYDQARLAMAGMTTEEKVAQLFFVRCEDDKALELVENYTPAGLVMFADNFDAKTSTEVKKTLHSYQRASRIALLMGIDEEGGSIVRLSKFPQFRDQPFPSPAELYESGGLIAVEDDAREKAALLTSHGLNMNFAPVCDVSTNPDDYIYDRTVGKSADIVAEFVRTVVQTSRKNGLASVLKHFPGYGDNSDTHKGVAYDERSMESFRESDFLPFKAGIEAGAEGVMVSHNVVSAMDSSLPASISPAVHNVLVGELGFSGFILTDDLTMEGIKQFETDYNAAVMAVLAGNDLLLTSDFDTQYNAVLNAVESGVIPIERVEYSVTKILAYKLYVGILY